MSFGTSPGAAPVGSRERSEAPVSSAGTGGADELAHPGSFDPVRPLSDISARDGRGVQKRPGPRRLHRAIPLDRPPPPLQCLGPEAPLLRRRQAKGGTARDPVAPNGARSGRGIERAGEFGGGHHGWSRQPSRPSPLGGEGARRSLTDEGDVRSGAEPGSFGTNPPPHPPPSQGAPSPPMGRRNTMWPAGTDPRVKPEDDGFAVSSLS